MQLRWTHGEWRRRQLLQSPRPLACTTPGPGGVKFGSQGSAVALECGCFKGRPQGESTCSVWIPDFQTHSQLSLAGLNFMGRGSTNSPRVCSGETFRQGISKSRIPIPAPSKGGATCAGSALEPFWLPIEKRWRVLVHTFFLGSSHVSSRLPSGQP